MSTRTRLGALALATAIVIPGAGAATLASDAMDAPRFEPNPRPHSTVIDWVDAMLEAVELNPPAPTATTWRMWVVLSSIYDAWAAYDDRALATASGLDLKRPVAEHTQANAEIAVDYAGFNALTYVYPDQSDIFDEVLAFHGRAPSDSVDPGSPVGVGNLAAEACIRQRLTDGSNAGTFKDTTSQTFPELYAPVAGLDPNHWVPLHVPTGTLTDAHGTPTWSDDDPSSFTVQSFLTPQWGAVIPFALRSGDELRPPPPPQVGSDEPYTDALGRVTTNDEAYREQVAEILGYSGSLTDQEKIIAEFWADGPHTWTPPGHWVQIAIGVSLRDHHDLGDDARMFMALSGALLDAGIAAWDAKRAYDYVRPATAIPFLYAGQQVKAWRGPDQGIGLIDGSLWRPYQSATFVTPPFAEYVSGHSAFSRAGAEVLTAFTGSDRMYDGVTRLGRDYDGDGVEDFLGQHIAVPGTMKFEHGPAEPVVLRWATFHDASDQAAISRRYGGIHFQDADLRAREMGRIAGQGAYERARSLWDPASE